MIINKEQIDSNDSNGNPIKLLIISYVNKNDEIVETNAVLNLSNFMIDEQIPMEFECFAYDKEIKPLKIRLIVKDHCEKNLKAISPWFTVI